jgi:hypothetical protein
MPWLATLLAGVALPGALVGAPVVDSTPVVTRCPAGSLCLWAQPDFHGRMTVLPAQQYDPKHCFSRPVRIGSVANFTDTADWALHLFLFHSAGGDRCRVNGVYAEFDPGRSADRLDGGPATGFRIIADPNPGAGPEPTPPPQHGRVGNWPPRPHLR